VQAGLTQRINSSNSIQLYLKSNIGLGLLPACALLASPINKNEFVRLSRLPAGREKVF